MLTTNQIIGRQDVLKPRFTSLQFQLKTIVERDNVQSILEIGLGRGYLNSQLKLLGYKALTNDINPDNKPDYIWDIRKPFTFSKKFDLVAAFEVLEHMPYSDAQSAIKNMVHTSKRYVVFSLPYQHHYFSFGFHLPNFLTRRRFGLHKLKEGFHKKWSITKFPSRDLLESPSSDYKPHHWELGTKSYPKTRFIKDVGLNLIDSFINPFHPYHIFMVYEK